MKGWIRDFWYYTFRGWMVLVPLGAAALVYAVMSK